MRDESASAGEGMGEQKIEMGVAGAGMALLRGCADCCAGQGQRSHMLPQGRGRDPCAGEGLNTTVKDEPRATNQEHRRSRQRVQRYRQVAYEPLRCRCEAWAQAPHDSLHPWRQGEERLGQARYRVVNGN